MFEYRVTSDGCRPAVPYDPEAEILCQLEECRENILQAIRLSTRREQFGPLLAVLMAVLEALTVVREADGTRCEDGARCEVRGAG